MTTVYKQKLLMLSFQGRSPRQIYIDSCGENKVHVQRALVGELSDIADDFGKLQHLLCSNILFGVRGCLAILPIIQCSRNLRRVDLRGCGVTDEFVAHLVEALQEHPTIRSIDLSDNPFITVHSGRGLVKLAELNTNIVACGLENTHVGVNVAKLVTSRCQQNRYRLISYFADDYFRMKDLFNAVDADGSGWVHIKNIIGSVSAPILQERLIERIAVKRPKKRSDNCVHINTFMELVYLNYKTLLEINERCQDPSNSVAATIKSNWKLIIEELESRRRSCDDLTRLRIRDVLLSRTEAAELVDAAIHFAADDAHNVEAPEAPENAATDPEAPPLDSTSTPAASSGSSLSSLNVRCLLSAFHSMFPPLPGPSKSETFGFLKERPDDYISPLLRNGSRCVSIGDISSSATPALSVLGEDDDDPPRTWKLPPAMVRAIIGLFQSQDILVDTLLDGKPETELEYLRISGLCGKFAQYSIPTDVSTLSVQEVVNMLDEYYEMTRVDKKFSYADIKAMCASS